MKTIFLSLILFISINAQSPLLTIMNDVTPDPYGEELIVGGTMDNPSDFQSIGTSWDISGGVATYSGVDNFQGLYFNNFASTLTAGTTVRLTFTISGAVSEARIFWCNQATGQILTGYSGAVNYADGSYEIIATVSGDALAFGIFTYNNNGGGAFSIDNVSIKEVLNP